MTNGNLGRMRCLAAAAVLVVTCAASAGQRVIGNWDSGGRTWNHSDFATIKTQMTLFAGNVVAANAPMTAQNLAGYDAYVIAEPTITPGTTALDDLETWVRTGGVLMVLSDGFNAAAPMNNILAAIGSTLSFSNSAGQIAALKGGVFASLGPPYDIVGAMPASVGSKTVSGGTELAGTVARYEKLDSGYVFAFGDRLDHNLFNPTFQTINGKLFWNLAEGPVPGPGGLTTLLLAGAACRRRRRR